MLVVIAIPAGLLIGISLGALGGGGSILTVPALVYLLHQQPHAATTGSLLIVGITALAGMAAHWREGRVRLGQGAVFGVLGVVGSYVGTRLSASVRPDVLLALFAVLMLVAAAAMLRRSRSSAPSPVPATGETEASGERTGPDASGDLRHPGGVNNVAGPGSADRALAVTLDRPLAAAAEEPATGTAKRADGTTPVRRALKVVAAATAVGLLTGFFGVGGGFVIVPALVLALGFDMATAVGTSLLVIAINSAVALAARAGEGIHLDWPLIGMFTAVALVGTLAGNRIASRVSSAKLSSAFTVLLIGVAIYTLARSLGGLL